MEMDRKEFLTTQLDKTYLENIGKIAVLHANIDNNLRSAIRVLRETNYDKTSAYLYRRQTNDLLDEVKILLEKKYGDGDELIKEYKEWKSVYKEKCHNKRNELLHSTWLEGLDFEKRGKHIERLKKLEGKIVIKIDRFDISDFEQIINDFYTQGWALFRIVYELHKRHLLGN